MWKTIKECLYILFGGLIFSVGINYFTIPNLLSEGGIIGLTVIAHYLFDLSPGMVNFVLNTVLVLIGYKFLEKDRLFIRYFLSFLVLFYVYHGGDW